MQRRQYSSFIFFRISHPFPPSQRKWVYSILNLQLSCIARVKAFFEYLGIKLTNHAYWKGET